MNTHIQYMYRDASNYKAHQQSDVIVEGELTWSEFKPVLHMGEMFIPADLDLPELQSQLESYPSVDDHIWHELYELEPTEDHPTVEITANEIKNRLIKIEETGCDEFEQRFSGDEAGVDEKSDTVSV